MSDRFTLPACEIDPQLQVISVNSAFRNTFRYSEARIPEAITLRQILGTIQVEKIRTIFKELPDIFRAVPFSAVVLNGQGQYIKCHIHIGLTGIESSRVGLLFFLPDAETDKSQFSTDKSLHDERMEEFWKALPGGVIAVCEDGRIEDLNDAALSALEYKPGELWHKGIDTICPEISSLERFSRADSRCRPKKLTLVTKRGNLIAVRASLQRFHFDNQQPYLFCFAEDTAGLYCRAWQRSESQLRSLIDNLRDGIALTDRDFHIRLCNDRMAALFNCPKDLLRGIDLAAFLQDHSTGTLKLPLSSVLDGEILERKITLLDRNKNSHTMHVSILPLAEPGDRSLETAVIMRDITRSRLTVENLRQQRENLKRLAGEIITVQEKERQSISRELHDNIAQKLAVVRLKVACVIPELNETHKKELEQATGFLEEIADDIRHIAADLRPQILDDLGLVPAIEWSLDEYSRCSHIETAMEIAGQPRRLSDIAEINLFRVFQELLLNAVKHSGAAKVEVRLLFSAQYITLIVADNGCGFKNSPRDPELLRESPHFGLLNITERLTYLGGDMTLENSEEGGAVIRVRMPG